MVLNIQYAYSKMESVRLVILRLYQNLKLALLNRLTHTLGIPLLINVKHAFIQQLLKIQVQLT